MTIQLLSVLSAAALAATGLGATGETRSAQSLPTQKLVMVQVPGAAASKFQTVRHLTDAASPSSDESNCRSDGGHWDDKKSRCATGAWWTGSGVRLLIGAGTIAGIVVALTESNHNSVSN